MTAPERRPRTLVFSHANGFPAGTYRKLFQIWRDAGWQVHAIERIGHDPRYPVSSNWPRLRDQLVEFIAPLGREQPVMLVGHSLGGFLSVLAASRAPKAVAGIVLLDSPIIAGWRARTLQMAKTTGLVRKVPPAKISIRRRHEWPDRAAVLHHFQAKAAFARWDPQVLDDYVEAGFDQPVPDGPVHLGFDREIETRIYVTLPHQMPAILRRHPLKSPVAFIGGTQSTEVRQVGLAATRALTHDRIDWIEGSHLYPMERPAETAERVLRRLTMLSGNEFLSREETKQTRRIPTDASG